MPADDRATGFTEICQKSDAGYKMIETSARQYNNMEYHEILEDMLKSNPETDGIFASSDLILRTASADVPQVAYTCAGGSKDSRV